MWFPYLLQYRNPDSVVLAKNIYIYQCNNVQSPEIDQYKYSQQFFWERSQFNGQNSLFNKWCLELYIYKPRPYAKVNLKCNISLNINIKWEKITVTWARWRDFKYNIESPIHEKMFDELDFSKLKKLLLCKRLS